MSFNFDDYLEEATKNKNKNIIRMNAAGAKPDNNPNSPPTKKKKRGRNAKATAISPIKGLKQTRSIGSLVGGGGSTPVGTSFPDVLTNFTKVHRYGVRELQEVARVAPVARSLWQLQLITFKYFDFKIVPPYRQELSDDLVAQLEPKMEEVDRKINTTICCSQAMYDMMTYGSAIFEIVWGEDEDGWLVPIALQRLPPESFKTAPPGVVANRIRYQVGHLLKGIVLDKTDFTMHYYQLQNRYSTVPVEIPAENIIHIKDRNSLFVDGEPYLAGIVHTISQLEFVRKRMMQAISRCGSPTMKVQVGIPKEYFDADQANGGLGISGAIPGEGQTILDKMYAQLWQAGCTIGENQTADISVVTPKGVDVDWQRPTIPINPTEPDQYLIREAISHIFPRDVLEVLTSAISTSSQPLLELLKIMVQGWQELCARPFENDLWTKFVIANGFEDYRVELEWAPPVPEDKAQKDKEAQEKFNNHVITLSEVRAALGEPPLEDDDEKPNNRETMFDELLKYKYPQSMVTPAPGSTPPSQSFGNPTTPTSSQPTGSTDTDQTYSEGEKLLKELQSQFGE